MPKKTLKPISTEVVVHGQPSPDMRAKLKQLGERVSDEQLIDALREIEHRRVSFVVGAIVAGVGFLAKKESLAHGEWMDWSRKFAGKYRAAVMAKCEHPFRISDELSHRSVQLYRFLGRHFLADMEQNNFQPDERDAAIATIELTPGDVVMLATLPPASQSAVVSRLEQWINGRSLKRMLTDFRRAENAADQEEIDEANRRRKKKKDDVAPGQLDFFEDMLRPLGEIDNLFDDRLFVEKTDKKFWLSVADKLETQARRARQMAKEIAS